MRRTDHQPRGNPTPYLMIDERVWWLREITRDKPMFGPHRFQYIDVLRDDLLFSFVKDLGPAFLFPGASPFNFWAANLYSVGEVMEIADRLREGKPPEGPEDHDPSDILERYKRQLDEEALLREHRTTSGPLITVQRD